MISGGARFTAVQPSSVYDLQPGDMGFSTIPGGVGGWVSFGQWVLMDGCRFTHAFIVIRNDQSGVWVIEAMPSGARIVKLIPGVGQFSRIGPGYAWTRPDLTDAQRGAITDQAIRYVGVPYGFTTYAALAAHRAGVDVKWLDDAISTSGTMICSQLVDQILTDAGFHIFADGRLPQNVTPGALFYASDPRVIYAPTVRVRATR